LFWKIVASDLQFPGTEVVAKDVPRGVAHLLYLAVVQFVAGDSRKYMEDNLL
jgi:hypothetical protein